MTDSATQAGKAGSADGSAIATDPAQEALIVSTIQEISHIATLPEVVRLPPGIPLRWASGPAAPDPGPRATGN